jgi:hypothetical protein
MGRRRPGPISWVRNAPSRLRWWLEDHVLETSRADAKVLAVLAGMALLVLGGVAARQVVRAQASTSPQRLVRLTTTVRQQVRVRRHGRTTIQWRVRHRVLYAQAQTVLQTATIHTPTGTRVVTRPVTRYHVIYRKRVVTVRGRTQRVRTPVTQTDTVRVTQPVTATDVRTITLHSTTTVVKTQTTTVITTVTLPGTTVTITVP